MCITEVGIISIHRRHREEGGEEMGERTGTVLADAIADIRQREKVVTGVRKRATRSTKEVVAGTGQNHTPILTRRHRRILHRPLRVLVLLVPPLLLLRILQSRHARTRHTHRRHRQDRRLLPLLSIKSDDKIN